MPRGGAILSLLTPYEPEDLKPKKRAKKLKPPRPRAPSPTTHGSPTISDSPTKPDTVARPLDSPTTGSSPTTSEHPKRDKGSGDSRVTHQFFDDRLAGLPGQVQALYFNLNRYRRGTSPLTVILTWERLAKRLACHENTVKRLFAILNKAGLAFKDHPEYGKGGPQGLVFRVITRDSPTVSGSPTARDTHKTKEKENQRVKVSPEDEAEYLAARAALEGRGGG